MLPKAVVMKIHSTTPAQCPSCGNSLINHEPLAQLAPGLPPLEEMYGEIERLIRSIVHPYVDASNPMLHFDELEAECRAKLAILLSKGKLRACPTRPKLFGMLKVCFRNHVHGLIQKHAYTMKRTGVKPPKRGASYAADQWCARSFKPVVLSLDDPESGIQIGVWDERSYMKELESTILANGETAVWRELTDQDCDQRRPTAKSMAKKLKMSDGQFTELRDSIRLKCRAWLA
jgi:hypothetical protein